MLKPSIVSCALFQFMRASNDFMGPLIYINSVKNIRIHIFENVHGYRDGFDWNRTLANVVGWQIYPVPGCIFMQDLFVDEPGRRSKGKRKINKL